MAIWRIFQQRIDSDGNRSLGIVDSHASDRRNVCRGQNLLLFFHKKSISIGRNKIIRIALHLMQRINHEAKSRKK